jgi:hypothetical protein
VGIFMAGFCQRSVATGKRQVRNAGANIRASNASA